MEPELVVYKSYLKIAIQHFKVLTPERKSQARRIRPRPARQNSFFLNFKAPLGSRYWLLCIGSDSEKESDNVSEAVRGGGAERDG